MATMSNKEFLREFENIEIPIQEWTLPGGDLSYNMKIALTEKKRLELIERFRNQVWDEARTAGVPLRK